MNILIEIKKENITLYLKNNKVIIDEDILENGINLSDNLLNRTEDLLVRNNLKIENIDKFSMKSDYSDNFTTVRIAETVLRTLNYYKNVD